MCSLILGGAASALVAAFSGVEALLDFMGAINPPKEFLFLSLALLALPHLADCLALRFFDYNITDPGFVTKFKAIAFEVSSSLLGIYRLAGGAIIILVTPPVFIAPSIQTGVMAILGLLFGFLCMAVCAGLSRHSRSGSYRLG